MTDRHEVVESILGPRYVWAVHTEPVRRLTSYIRTLEEMIGELKHVKPCECPPTDYHAVPDSSKCKVTGDLEVFSGDLKVLFPSEHWDRDLSEVERG